MIEIKLTFDGVKIILDSLARGIIQYKNNPIIDNLVIMSANSHVAHHHPRI